jgi:hypothetical protein
VPPTTPPYGLHARECSKYTPVRGSHASTRGHCRTVRGGFHNCLQPTAKSLANVIGAWSSRARKWPPLRQLSDGCSFYFFGLCFFWAFCFVFHFSVLFCFSYNCYQTGVWVIWTLYTPIATLTGCLGSLHPCQDQLARIIYLMHCRCVLAFLRVYCWVAQP